MLFKMLNFFAKEATQSKRVYNPDWKYAELVKTPLLYSSYELAAMTKRAKNRAQVIHILQHIERHNVTDLETYGAVYDKCQKKLKSMSRKKSDFDRLFNA